MTTFSERKQQISISILRKLDLIYLRSKRCPKIHMDYGHTCSHTSLAQLLGFQKFLNKHSTLGTFYYDKDKSIFGCLIFFLGFIHPPLMPIAL